MPDKPEVTPEQITAWQERERCRFYETWNGSGHDAPKYLPVPVDVPWPDSYPSQHYLHLSVVDGEEDAVAYTPSDAYGVADRQVRLKFGCYLKKTFPEKPDTWVADLVCKFKAARAFAVSPHVLHFATGKDRINDIFETPMCARDSGCLSCMHGKFADDTIRPYHVYADSPDVAVAYVTKADRIVSRTVVNQVKRRWIRPYAATSGDNGTECGILESMLSDAGYEKGSLLGCRLTKLDTADVMLPYLDGNATDVDDEGDWWRVVSNGDYSADRTTGDATQNVSRCDSCNNRPDDCECSYCPCCDTHSPDGCNECDMCERCDRCVTHSDCNCTRCGECGELRAGIYSHQRDECSCDRCETCDELEDECECDDRPYHTCEPDPDAKYDGMDAAGARAFLNRVFVCLRDTRETAEGERAILIAAYNRL